VVFEFDLGTLEFVFVVLNSLDILEFNLWCLNSFWHSGIRFRGVEFALTFWNSICGV
jgi:hypothetical protein